MTRARTVVPFYVALYALFFAFELRSYAFHPFGPLMPGPRDLLDAMVGALGWMLIGVTVAAVALALVEAVDWALGSVVSWWHRRQRARGESS